MKLEQDLVFRPLPPIADTNHFPFGSTNPLDPITELVGNWSGKGFNVIWRPFFSAAPAPPQDRFLELNLTNDAIQFDVIAGPIPNRGLLQPDINMFGITYLQQVQDANVHAALHIEPGIWAVVPQTTNPAEVATVVRMGSIPHGTTILAQGTGTLDVPGPPAIPDVDIFPFPIGDPGAPITNFPEQTLATPSVFRSQSPQINGITQTMVNNPNSVLQAALLGQTILHTTTLHVSTVAPAPIDGGGTANTAFLAGANAPGGGPNAAAVVMDCTFWIELVAGSPNFFQLQYSQKVLLNFNGLSWPHFTVGTLTKNVPVGVPVRTVDPDIPAALFEQAQKPINPDVGAPVRSTTVAAARHQK
ncbi:heme-binding protein [Granulicella sp. dw_53]|uniref:heme-binding protein n=1 Tax=Granulicella sp. dw_53 TaxID=2719792 RepID=UPI001BD65FFF|nr:heme-binding protein [Granulicella sp. dw_53]